MRLELNVTFFHPPFILEYHPFIAYSDCQVYDSIKDVLNSESQGRITVLHYPNYEDMDAEIICGALEQFTSISSKYPKYLIIDNQDVLTHPCNSK